MAIFVIAVLVTRRHIANVVRTILGRPSGIDDSQEPIRYRTALLLIVLSSLFIIWFCLRAGMTLPIILPFFGFFFAISIAITRVRAELGPPAHEMAGMCNAQQFLINILGTRRIGPNNLTVFPYFWFFSGRGYREHIMPHQLEAFKMAERANMNTKRLVLAMIIAVVFGSLASFWATLSELYRLGGCNHRRRRRHWTLSWAYRPIRVACRSVRFPARSRYLGYEFYGRRDGTYLLSHGYADAFHLVATPSSRLSYLYDRRGRLFLELSRYQQLSQMARTPIRRTKHLSNNGFLLLWCHSR